MIAKFGVLLVLTVFLAGIVLVMPHSGGGSEGGAGIPVTQIAACLRAAGDGAQISRNESGFESVIGKFADGGGLVIVNLPDSGLAHEAIRHLEDEMRRVGRSVSVSTLNERSTVVGVI